MKTERQNAIRELVSSAAIQSQNDLRRKLRRRGFAVTQATLSRDLHDLHLLKGPEGYRLSGGTGHTLARGEDEDRQPTVVQVLNTFGLRSQRALNQVVVGTVMGGAQPVAAALDNEQWPGVVGTIAGDDTVLVICADTRHASTVQQRMQGLLEG